MVKYKDLSPEALEALSTEKLAAFNTLRDSFADGTPTEEQIVEAETLAAELDEIEAAGKAFAAKTAELSARADKIKTMFASDPGAPEDEDPDDANKDEDEGEEPSTKSAAVEPEAPVEAATTETEEEEIVAAAKPQTVGRLAKRTTHPDVPAEDESRSRVSITASADVPNFAAGQNLDSLSDVAQAVGNRVKGFPTFNPNRAARGSGRMPTEPQLHKFGVASFKLDFPEELTISRASDDMEVLELASKESRLEGDSLVAAGGWCAPSETIYDLCDGETLDGIISVPEVNVTRGGINYTSGPQFADFYTQGFTQTEAQAIAGTAKACYEITCPAFTEVRLDAVGLCITVPILTDVAYPELTRRVISGSMVAHQHRVNSSVIARMVALSGPARIFAGLGSSVGDGLAAFELAADQRRQIYRLGLNESMEVILPFWVRGAFRSDLALRQGVAADAISDAQIEAHFTARHLAVQWAYDWQPLDTTAEVYPTTYNALMYPAGTFVKGVSDVINLSAVYDAASLKVNTYTGVFFEQGLLVAKMCYSSDLLTLPVCNAGRVGAANLTCV